MDRDFCQELDARDGATPTELINKVTNENRVISFP